MWHTHCGCEGQRDAYHGACLAVLECFAVFNRHWIAIVGVSSLTDIKLIITTLQCVGGIDAEVAVHIGVVATPFLELHSVQRRRLGSGSIIATFPLFALQQCAVRIEETHRVGLCLGVNPQVAGRLSDESSKSVCLSPEYER